jgi:hypothetical protein
MPDDYNQPEFAESLTAFRAALRAEGLQSLDPAPPPFAFAAGADDELWRPSFATAFGFSTRRGRDSLSQMVLKLFFYAPKAVVRKQFQRDRYRFAGNDVEVEAIRSASTTVPEKPPTTSASAAQQVPQMVITGGVSIGLRSHRLQGTLGCFVRPTDPSRSDELYVLSNAHILSMAGLLNPGAEITHPGWEQTPPTATEVFSKYERDSRLNFVGAGGTTPNTIDAAIALVIDHDKVMTGKIANLLNYRPDEILPVGASRSVVKCGRTTGFTEGVVDTIGLGDLSVLYSHRRRALFRNVFRVTGYRGEPFARVGDSGSLIVDKESGHPVGLLFAVDAISGAAYGCDLKAVCDHFNVKPA